ncbi:MAG: ribonuclease HII [Cyclobacteriaceae bacterium]|nr:ribonuclease HII [Cyclobacteriaceae bacterium]
MLKSSYTKDKIEAGCDEVGRGCLAGPVVAAAVILPKKFKHKLLTDSKQLKKKDREQLEREIKDVAMAWAVAEVSHQEIDEINILNASFKAMHLALDQLGVEPEFLLIDGNRFITYRKIEHQCIVKGDSKYLSIAAASILAKTYRDKLMEKLSQQYPGYGWESNMGYPTIQHRDGIRLLGITPYHRRSFQLLPAQLELF